jgi:hypothetical protein
MTTCFEHYVVIFKTLKYAKIKLELQAWFSVVRLKSQGLGVAIYIKVKVKITLE